MKTDEKSRRRLFRDDDYVRHEIATALARNIPVIPVLVRGAKMPTPESLPPDLAQLSFRNAVEITDPDFDHDVGRLIQGLEYVFGEQRPVLPPPAKTGGNNCLLLAIGLLVGGGGILLAIILIAAYFANPDPSPSPAPSPEPSQAFSPTPEPEKVDFEPVGSWTYQIASSPPGRIDLHRNNTYQAASAEFANIEGTWRYSPIEGKLTLIGFFEDAEATYDAEITIEREYGDQYFGRINSKGSTWEIWLRRQ